MRIRNKTEAPPPRLAFGSIARPLPKLESKATDARVRLCHAVVPTRIRSKGEWGGRGEVDGLGLGGTLVGPVDWEGTPLGRSRGARGAVEVRTYARTPAACTPVFQQARGSHARSREGEGLRSPRPRRAPRAARRGPRRARRASAQPCIQGGGGGDRGGAWRCPEPPLLPPSAVVYFRIRSVGPTDRPTDCSSRGGRGEAGRGGGGVPERLPNGKEGCPFLALPPSLNPPSPAIPGPNSALYPSPNSTSLARRAALPTPPARPSVHRPRPGRR